jgi:hypothetical protein
MDVVSDELDPVVGVVARRQKHFKRADKIFQYLRMAPGAVVARHEKA